MKKILTIIFIFASLFASSQELMNKNFEGFRVKVSELVIDNDTLNISGTGGIEANKLTVDTLKIDGVPLLLNTFKKDSLGGAGNIFYSTGASSQPASGTVNQVVGGGLLTNKYLTRWDGSKFVNSGIIENVGYFSINQSELRFNASSNSVGNAGQQNVTTNQYSNNVGHAGQQNVTTNTASNNVGHAGQQNATTNTASNNVGSYGQQKATTNLYSNNVGNEGFRYSSTGLPVKSITKGLSLGHNTRCLDTISTNEIVIGADAVGHGNNTATFGNMLITDNYFNGNLIADTIKARKQFISLLPTGTPPLVVASSTVVDSLNAGLLDGKHASDFQLKSDTLTFDATLSDLADSSAAIRAFANTKAAVVSGTNNFIPKITGANTLGNSNISTTDSSISVNCAQNTYNWLGTTVNSSFSLKGRSSGITNDSPFSIFNSNNDAVVKFNNDGRLDLSSTNSYGSVMVLNNSHTATVNQMTGHYAFSGKDNLGQTHTMGYMSNIVTDPTPSSLDSKLYFYVMKDHDGSSGGWNQPNSYFFFDGNKIDLQNADMITLGNISAGTTSAIAKFQAYQNIATDSVIGSYKLISSEGGLMIENSIYNKKYTYRDADGKNWLTSRWHDALDIDGVFSTPQNNTRTWWERDPYNNIQSWGTNNTTYFTLNVANAGFGTTSPAARIHSQSTATQARLGYDANKYTDLSTGSTGNLTIDPTGDTVKVVGAVNSTGGFFKNGVEITGGTGSMVYPINPGIVQFNGTTWGTSITNNSTLWNQAYDKKIVSAAFSGTSTKTLTLYQQDGNVLQASFTDESSGGSMTWPATAGIPVYSGSNSWSTSKAAPSGTIVGTTDSQVLTNKSVNGVTLSTSQGTTNFLRGDGTYAAPSGGGGSMVYPSAGIPVSTGSSWGTSKTSPSGAIVGTTDNQALTNKSVNGVTLSTGAGSSNYLAGDGSYKNLSTVSQWTNVTGGILYENGVRIGNTSHTSAKLNVTATDRAIQGESDSNQGIYGGSNSGNGVYGVSSTGVGVYGNSSTGFGGLFEGLGCKSTKYYVSSLNTAPASSTATGTTGEIRFTSDYIYVCVATNTWKRTQISTW